MYLSKEVSHSRFRRLGSSFRVCLQTIPGPSSLPARQCTVSSIHSARGILFFFFKELPLPHTAVLWLEVELELQLLAYTIAAAT